MGKRMFSMIELLVVISIIGLLVGLLAPVLTSSKEQGRKAVCANNLAQIHKANSQYSVDFGCYCPARGVEGGRSGRPNFWFGYQENAGDEVDYAKGFLARYMSTKEDDVIHCPSWTSDNSAARGYGYNSYGVGSLAYVNGYDDSGHSHYAQGMLPEKFESPSTTIMFGDCAAYSGGQLVEDKYIYPTYGLTGASTEQLHTKKPTTNPRPSRVHARHNALANLTWVDGHVEHREVNFAYKLGGDEDSNALANNIGTPGPKDNTLWDPWKDEIPDSAE